MKLDEITQNDDNKLLKEDLENLQESLDNDSMSEEKDLDTLMEELWD